MFATLGTGETVVGDGMYVQLPNQAKYPLAQDTPPLVELPVAGRMGGSWAGWGRLIFLGSGGLVWLRGLGFLKVDTG